MAFVEDGRKFNFCKMSRFLLSLLLLNFIAFSSIHADVQEQEPEDHEHLVVHVKELERNLTELWTRVHDLEAATLKHLTHLRQHQVEIESTLDHLGHHDGHHDDHHSSGHGDDHHSNHSSHSDDHHDDHHGNHSGHDDHHDDHHDSSHGSDHHDDHHSSHSDDHHTDDHHSEHHSSQSEHHDNDHHDDHQSSSSTDDHHHDHHDEQKSSSGDDHGHHGDHHEDHSKDKDDHHGHHGDHHGDHSKEKDDHGHHGDHHGDHSKEKDDHGHHGDHHGDHSKEKDDHSKEHDDHSKEHDDHQQTKDVAEPLIVPMKHKSHSYQNTRQIRHQDRSEDVLSQFSKHESNHGRENRTLIPTMQDRYVLNFAECEVHPNPAIDPDHKQNVIGKVSFWQKKDGGPLGIYVHLQGFKVDGHQNHQQHDDSDHNEAPIVEHGHIHGFHVHESGEITDGCQSAGPHFNPEHVNHGGPKSNIRHVGDFGNIECDEHGIVDLVFYDTMATLSGDHSILDRGLVIHENEDDLGSHPDDPESMATGNAGARIACCTIHSLKRFSLRTFKNIKQAASHHH